MKNLNNLNKKTLTALALVAIMATTTVGAFASTDNGNRDTSKGKGTQAASTETLKVNHATIGRKIDRESVGSDSTISPNQFTNHGTNQTKLVAARALLRDSAKLDKEMKNEKDANNGKSDTNDKLMKNEKAQIAADIAAMPTLKPLYVQLDALKATEKANREAERTANASIRVSMNTIRHSMEGLAPAAVKFVHNDLMKNTKLYRETIEAKNTDIHTLQKTMNAEWVDFRTAVLAKHEAKAFASLTRIVDLKSKIVAKHTEMAPFRMALAELLKSYVLPAIPATLTPAARLHNFQAR